MNVKVDNSTGVVSEVKRYSVNRRHLHVNIKIEKRVTNKVAYLQVTSKPVVCIVVMNLLACMRLKESLYYSRDKSRTTKGTYNTRGISNYKIMKAIDELEEQGYLTNYIAPPQYDSYRDEIMTSFITPTNKFIEKFCTNTELLLKAQQAHLASNVNLVLKDVHGKAIEYEDSPLTTVRERVVFNLNQMNSQHKFIDDDGFEFVNTYSCIFNNSSFELGGRYYRASILNMENKKSKDRLRIIIDDEPVVEVDYGNLHLRMIAEQLGCSSCLGADAYLMPLTLEQQMDKAEANRDLIKYSVNVMINSLSRGKAVQAIQSQINQAEKGTYGFTSGKDVVDVIYDTFPLLKDSFCQPGCTGLPLMHYESEMTTYVAHQMVLMNCPFLPVHDSAIVRARDAEMLIDLMAAAYREKFPSAEKVHMKLNKIHNNVHVKIDVSR